MMQTIFKIPSDIEEKSNQFFSVSIKTKAMRFLRNSKVSISFAKGGPDTYFIVSGIIKEDRTHESKVVYKKRLEDSADGPLSSNCDCHDWSEDNHCPHTAALYILYLHKSMAKETAQMVGQDPLRPPISIESNYAASVTDYGTLLKGPHQLQGVQGSPTYSSLQYLLHNRKTINFPIPDKFKGRLIVNITDDAVSTSEDELVYIPRMRFSYQNQAGEEVEQTSIFENLYLFDWKNGLAFHMEGHVKDFIQKIKLKGMHIQSKIILRWYQQLESREQLILKINGQAIDDLEEEIISPRIHINKGEKKTQLDFILYFENEKEEMAPPPEVFRSFCFAGGHLDGFRKKKDAYHFLEQLHKTIKHEQEQFKKTLLGCSSRDTIEEYMTHLMSTPHTVIYDNKRNKILKYDNHLLKDIYKNIYELFGELFFRFSVFSLESSYVKFTATGTTIFDGLNPFFNFALSYGINIYYDRHEISKWNNKVRFERKLSTTKWFDLELHVGNMDLDIIKNMDLDTGISFTSKGLVLLGQDQKDVLRFLKKYTQYENQNKYIIPASPDGEGQDEDGNKIPAEEVTSFVLPFNRARIFELFELKKMGIEGALTAEEEALCKRLATLEEVPQYDIPSHLVDVLRPYQKTGYNWLRFLHENGLGACLADDMGLGKTLQTISFLQSINEQIDSVLIVCPVTILLNWEKEFQKFSDLSICVYHGGDRVFPEDKKIIITSYGVMKKEAEDTFKNKEFDIFILDEVQHLKNIRSRGAFAARTIKADFRICLTGTPVENDLAEFYNILDLSVPGIWGDLQFFRTTSNKKSRLVAKKTAAPFILRRTKDQVLTELPPKIENNVYLNFGDEEKDNYVNLLKSIRERINVAPSKKKYGEILRGLLELRQSCLWQCQDRKNPDYNNFQSTKIEFLMETLGPILEEGHQAIIFSQFTTYLNIIQHHLHEKHWKWARIDGSQTIKKRQGQVDIFQSGQAKIFLISLKAGGVGLNLTAASYVFIMDPWWNPAVEAQAIDRAHRIGQQNHLTVYRPIIKSSVEEKVLELQKMKKELFNDLLNADEDAMFNGKLTMKDFELLLT